jgi:hypothetical protein
MDFRKALSSYLWIIISIKRYFWPYLLGRQLPLLLLPVTISTPPRPSQLRAHWCLCSHSKRENIQLFELTHRSRWGLDRTGEARRGRGYYLGHRVWLVFFQGTVKLDIWKHKTKFNLAAPLRSRELQPSVGCSSLLLTSLWVDRTRLFMLFECDVSLCECSYRWYFHIEALHWRD